MCENSLRLEVGESISLSRGDWTVTGQKGSDFWRAFLDTGENRELAVYSHCQTPVKTERTADTTVFTYDTLIAEDGQSFPICLTLTVREEDGSLVFTSEIQNRSAAILNELQYPFFSASDFGCAPKDEVLYIAEGLGVRVPNPRLHVAGAHTEYMAADYKGIWRSYTYPAAGMGTPITMPWLGLQCGEKHLYLGEHNPELRLITLNVGVPPRGAEGDEMMLSISHYPAAHPSETVSIGRSVMAVFDGDWRDASAFYRAWSEKTWMVEHPIPDWVKDLTGWQRVICKHQYGEVFWKYADLPKLWEEGMQYGINGLLLFGWWRGRFDNNYPELEPDPALGGAEGLRAAIAEIRAKGGEVLLYSNGNLIDVKTDFYKHTGQRISHKDIDGNEYREHYQFSNDGTVLRNFGYKSFDTACHTTKEWQENLLRIAKLKLSFDPSAIFFDQVSCCLKLCFDSTHPHGFRIDEDGIGRWNNLRAIRNSLPEGKSLGVECVNDRYCNIVDFVHGFGNGMHYGWHHAFPDLYLHTFPEVHISNRGIHDDKADFQDHLNHAFVYGLIFDTAIYRCRRVGIAALPEYAEYQKKLIDLKEKYHKYFYRGTFRTMYGEGLPACIRSAKFVADGGFAVALWNTSAEDVTLQLYGREIRLGGNAVAVEEFNG